MDVQSRKLMFVHIKTEPLVLKNEEKMFCLGEQNFTDQVVFDFLSQYAY